MLFSNSLLACVFFTTCTASPKPPNQIRLPKPGGKYEVGLSITELTDHNRTQPFAPNGTLVQLMISVFYPVTHKHHAITRAYMTPETALIEDITLSSQGLAAPNGTFGKVVLQLASDQNIQSRKDKSSRAFPLVFFMPGEGTTRLFYNQIASTVASKGYIVVTIDAPYDVDVVQYSDGSFAYINQTLWANDNSDLASVALLAIQTRMADVSFVLDSLSGTTLAHSLVPNLPESGLNTTHTAMFGHSLGDCTAYSILDVEDRILGGLTMDGDLDGPPLLNGTSKPFMFIGSTNHTRENADDDPGSTWLSGWPQLLGWKKYAMVADTMHYDFSDYPILFETLGITPTNGTTFLMGDLKGKRALEIVTTYVGAFLDFVLLGKDSRLLDGPVKQFPEVTFEN
ncbi:putative 1-alkyl-2-acetylglycerophosphocholine esterase [Lachnellula hyalina]|uniref:1-alkyl-2-acetylglycerophosphocholine esterase n=1 Tax=Lachnellula hyalina TaxID=1316788 RepID=A0A8H8TX65_9HELO|nr:putative 1-alkyl-2-acetylglycerophosphocholine esterase [Lachnellula hyalina]TVY22646.1 putative 1-alkyl-2-acetylglycerophosphocholine esterase [Lachnellula hyalina]